MIVRNWGQIRTAVRTHTILNTHTPDMEIIMGKIESPSPLRVEEIISLQIQVT